jgi:ribosomal protein S18 acetylase RimI-like enzyme
MSDPLTVRAWRILREEGLRSGWFKALAMLGYRRFYILRRSLAEPIPDCPTMRPVTMEWLGPEQVHEYLALRPTEHAGDILRRLGEGDRCLVARLDDRLVGAMWGSGTRARSEWLPLATGEAYQFNAYTAPECRGMGIAPAMSVAWLRLLRDEGFSAAIRLTLPENTAALRAHAKAGYRVVGMARTLRLGPWRYHMCP